MFHMLMTMKKIAVGSWAFGQPLSKTFKDLSEIGYDGVAVGFFPPYGVRRSNYDTPEKETSLKILSEKYGLEVAECGLDMYGANALTNTEKWLEEFEENICFAKRLGITDTFRVDTGVPPVVPVGFEYDRIKAFYVKTFKKMARRAAQDGFTLVWEFEPGFILNEPANIVDIVKSVDEPNFKLQFDTCHAYNCANGLGHIDKGMKLRGGIQEFIEMCEDLIGMVHLIDSDGTLMKIGVDIMGEKGERVELETSRHSAFGTGHLDFDAIMPALVDVAKYDTNWWVIDMELNPMEYAKTALEFVKKLNVKYFG